MAEAAANNSADALSSPSSVNGAQRPWDQVASYSQEFPNSVPSKTRPSHDSSAIYSKYNHKHNVSYAMNGASMSRTSSRSGSRQGHLHDQGYRVPHRVDALNQKDPSLSRTGSDTDSLLDLYGRESANRSTPSVLDQDKRSENRAYYEDEDPDQSQWIHRDKLAKIESEELQQFGIQIRDPVLMGRKSGSRRGRSRESHSVTANGITDRKDASPAILEDGEQRIPSPIPIEDNAPKDEDEPAVFDDPRLPEEIAADPYEDGGHRMYRNPGLRKSSSRIPILAYSPHPIPQEHLEREAPLQRTRNNTINSRDEDGLSFPKTRRPSVSAPLALQTPESQIETTPPQTAQTATANQQLQNSPSKPKQTTKSTSRKTSGASDTRKISGTHKKPTPSNANGNTSNQRPGTRSSERRPGTALNRPEGDPPWLATMYKPDPRLPPDQQMLPTHAKRLQQEQWEKEGKIPSAYDKDFGPLTIRHDGNDPPPAPESEKPKDEPAPIVTTRPSPTQSPEPTDRSRTSETDRGGYKAIPTMLPAPPAPTFTTSISAKPVPSPIQVEPEQPVKKKGCPCCVIM
ncbi:hypothetical protein PRK78_000688 [Emydomyces testavorans]|uniref:TeaA receptor TeaR n=1 Tax=Emydomyces testavorans TaxID=2070801 RepID=A0AAF0IHV6_9EURO|nr:hypothetical protein PRK78_000688 [Emydomyces testavorans]